MTSHIQEHYDAAIHPARERFLTGPALSALFSSDPEPTFLELLLIHFCSLGVALTRPVEDWLLRSSKRCAEIGLTDLSRALRSHARAEAGHDQMMVHDTHALVARWNAHRKPLLSAESLLDRAPTPGGRMYQQLHEDSIVGPTPFVQIAIEYEIELLPVQFGPSLLERCKNVLGSGILPSLTFLEEHITLDKAHSRFNALHLERLLQEHPTFLDPLVRAGAAALDAYRAFLGDCIVMTRAHLAGLQE
jgi:hypothetical protein